MDKFSLVGMKVAWHFKGVFGVGDAFEFLNIHKRRSQKVVFLASPKCTFFLLPIALLLNTKHALIYI